MHMVHWSASRPRIPLNYPLWPESIKKGKNKNVKFIAVISQVDTWWQCVAWTVLPWEDSGRLPFCLEVWCLAHSGQRSSESGWRPPQRRWAHRSATETTAATKQHTDQTARSLTSAGIDFHLNSKDESQFYLIIPVVTRKLPRHLQI